MIDPEAKLLAVNLWDKTSYVLPKYSGRTDTGLAIAFQRKMSERRKGKES